tara:strand:+ start:1482 stop:1979 length:498 start_codon:yes stop_codon:yes gene_type:complete
MFKFDATKMAPSTDLRGDFEPIEKGFYGAVVKEAVLTPTKAGDGEYIKLRLDITHGEHKGRVVFHNMTYSNANEIATQIGRQQLTDLCYATGKLVPKSTDELCNIPVIAKVGFVPAKNGYDATNDIKSFKKFDEALLPEVTSTPFLSVGKGITVDKDSAPWNEVA